MLDDRERLTIVNAWRDVAASVVQNQCTEWMIFSQRIVFSTTNCSILVSFVATHVNMHSLNARVLSLQEWQLMTSKGRLRSTEHGSLLKFWWFQALLERSLQRVIFGSVTAFSQCLNDNPFCYSFCMNTSICDILLEIELEKIYHKITTSKGWSGDSDDFHFM